MIACVQNSHSLANQYYIYSALFSLLALLLTLKILFTFSVPYIYKTIDRLGNESHFPKTGVCVCGCVYTHRYTSIVPCCFPSLTTYFLLLEFEKVQLLEVYFAFQN